MGDVVRGGVKMIVDDAGASFDELEDGNANEGERTPEDELDEYRIGSTVEDTE